MRLGVFGGTFDPVHLAHLIVAERCREAARLDRVLFVPAMQPPHKAGVPTPFERRVEMLELALAGSEHFAVDQAERERPGPSYTADLLAQLASRDAGAELFLILGGDSLAQLHQWYAPERIVALATLLVVARPGSEPPDLAGLRQRLGLAAEAPLRVEVVPAPLLELSSSDIRQRCRLGQSIRYLVPRAVEVYIHERRLYRPPEPPPPGCPS
jgi:nicotinate-nucleotide adenylyltransferase